MPTRITKSGLIGDLLYGELPAGEVANVEGMYDVAVPPEGFGRTSVGWGVTGQRVYGRPSYIIPSVAQPVQQDAIGVSVSTASGAFLGRLRTDARRPILRSLQFTIDDAGCADMSLVLNKPPPFPIAEFAGVDINIFGSAEPWYAGELTDTPEFGTGNVDDEEDRGYTYKGFGYRKALDTMKEDKDYVAVTDVGNIVNDLTQNYIMPRSSIRYNPSKIDHPIGVLTANAIELSKHPMKKVLETLSLMGSRFYGVDGARELYYKDQYAGIKKTLFVGWGCEDVKIKRNPETVRNSIIIQRAQGKGSGGAGWVVAWIENDDTSIAKYKKKELFYQVPGSFGDAECELIAQRLLARLKDPQITIQIKNVPIRSAADFYDAGTYKVVLPPGVYDSSLNDCEDSAQWSLSGSGDLAVANDTVKYMSGAKSIKLSYTTSANKVAILTVSPHYKAFVRKIRIWVYCSRQGQLFTMGIGRTNWNERTVPCSISLASQFHPIEWDVSGYDIREIGKIGFRIDDASATPTNIYVDRIEVQASGHRTFVAKFKRGVYFFEPMKQVADLEFGDMPPRMEQYLAGLLATADELKFTGEVR